ncbi:MAG: hypothetical protein LBQ63_02020 [Deltaproteobacteria bacterium]|jgi:hypothetical protein|nr:hypothetical protein [Deltaproteobacteria bacterium]
MQSINRPRVAFAAACFCLAALQSPALPAVAANIWTYHEEKYEIYAPRLSHDNNYLVFTRKLHFPDGYEAELFSEKDKQDLRDWATNNKRAEEPEVVLMKLADKSMRVIGQGWDPCFSHDRRSIAYARQTKPLAGLRVLGTTLAGNEIYVYDIAGDSGKTVARPSSGYFSQPVFTEKGQILFAISDAVNGAYGGDIGVGLADPADGTQRVECKPAQDYGLYHLIRKFEMREDRLFVLRMRPLSAGTYMADKYAYELVEAAGGEPLYNWGDAKPYYDRDNFRICPSGVEVYDRGIWRKPGDAWPENTKTAPEGRMYSSPDCEYEAVVRDRRGGNVSFAARGRPAFRWRSPKGMIQSVTWSPDSSRVILVISYGMKFGEKFAFDELVILAPRDMRNGGSAVKAVLRRYVAAAFRFQAEKNYFRQTRRQGAIKINGVQAGGAKYTRSRRPVKLLAFRVCPDKKSAYGFEYVVKAAPRGKKLDVLLPRDLSGSS